jgi:membrane fusion protein, multidrug efflux system
VAPSTATARAKAGGTLVTLDVAEGSRVRAGQSLGRVDLADLATRVAEREALLAQAQARLAGAERTHASNEQLAAQNYISPVALQNSQVTLDAARAERDAARATLQATRIGLRDAELRAPISGIVAKRHAVAGERLSADQEVVTIVDLSQLELAGTVATHDVARLQPGMAVTLKVEGTDTPVTGRLARIAPAAEAGTRSIGVTVALANPEERMRAGQYAVAEVQVDDPTPRLTVPLTAVGATGGQEHVWVIDGGVLARRAITTGRRDPIAGQVEVLQGLTPAAKVLAQRFDNLREGRAAVVVEARREPSVATNPAPAVR